jgi:hypothetical protein
MRQVTLPLLLLLAGCATGYHATGFSGGFSETQLGSEVWQVSFNGNGYTSSQRAEDFALLRCAEVASSAGFPYFVLISGQDSKSLSTITTPTTKTGSATVVGNSVYGTATTTGGQTYVVQKPGRRNTILGLKQKPEGFAFESAFVIRSLRAKYSLPPVGQP